ncbi:MAG TPA: DUF1800 domain-containing protein, partial [Terriglobales bacterium]|nr:DUF1800 domain-containing protein [Terriglobales bacterium]
MRRYSAAIALLVALLAPLLLQGKKQKLAQVDEHKRALHALNRLTFGPRPGDLQRVEALGVDKWIELQLHPEKIDDGALAARLEPLRTLRMSTPEIVENFPPQPLIKAVADGKRPLPSDPQERAIYEAQLQRYQRKEEQQAALHSASSDSSASANYDERGQRRRERMDARTETEQILNLPPGQRMAAILHLPPEQQQVLVRSLPPHERESLLVGLDPRQRETVMALQNPQQVVSQELMAGRLLRDIYSQRQLQEVMTDFWLNHFNVFVGKGADRYLLTSYERDVIRPRALGKFKDLLVATAQSPAMLFYLDNWLSVGPDSDVARGTSVRRSPPLRPRARMGPWGPRVGVGMPFPRPQRPRRAPGKQNQKRSSGLNENYARELMELHTLGVNGGYTQQDVIEVAKVFTGWTIEQPRQGGGFHFEERMHQPGDKLFLSHRIKPGGEEEGVKVLDLLARSPATAKFICTKLAQRFVSDNPPPALVARMQSTFLKKDGDIREVLRAMFRSPEFWAPEAYRAKVKTPLEFVASAVRATGAEVNDPQPLLQFLNRMGEPLYGCQPPNGYSMMADAWVNSSALLNRMNFALALATGRLPGLNVSSQQMLGMPDVAPDAQMVLT